MNIKRAAAIFTLFALIVICGWRVVNAVSFVRTHSTARPNVLIVSVCSLRSDMLSLFGAKGPANLPHLEKFFGEANFVFKNAFNGMGWTNIANYTQANVGAFEFLFNRYDDSGPLGKNNHLWRVPMRRSSLANKVVANDNYFEKDYFASVTEAEKFFRQPHENPFFAVVHFKYLHYPLIDRFNQEADWDRYLSAEEKSIVADYLAHPDIHYRKLPLLLMLANEPKHLLAHPKFKGLAKSLDDKGLKRLMGMMTNPELLADWKSSSGYEQDLEILKKVYRANVNYLDRILEPFLNVWNDPKLRENTVVMFIADHGESHMERDELTHGSALWDPLLRVPVAIRFPDSREKVTFDRQIDDVGLSWALRDLVSGARDSSSFRNSIERSFRDAIPLRNCNNDIRGLRFANRFKYFVTLRDGERHLYDLTKDPGETQNLAADQPEEVAEMESLYWENLASLGNVDANNCAPTTF